MADTQKKKPAITSDLIAGMTASQYTRCHGFWCIGWRKPNLWSLWPDDWDSGRRPVHRFCLYERCDDQRHGNHHWHHPGELPG